MFVVRNDSFPPTTINTSMQQARSGYTQNGWRRVRRQRSSGVPDNLIKAPPEGAPGTSSGEESSSEGFQNATGTPGAYAIRREEASSESSDDGSDGLDVESAECMTLPVGMLPVRLNGHGEAEQVGVVSEQETRQPCYKNKTSLVLLGIFTMCGAVIAASVVAVILMQGHRQESATELPSSMGSGDAGCNFEPGASPPDPFIQCACSHLITELSDRVRTAYHSLKNSSELRDHLEDSIDIHSCSPVNKALVWVAMELSAAIHPFERVVNRFVLALFYASTGGVAWKNSDKKWLTGSKECNWYGVDCDGDGGNIISIKLPGNNLRGTLDTRLGLLPNLRSVALDRNGIDGTIPASMFAFPALKALSLSENKLVGSLPPTVEGYATGLQQLVLGSNDITGPMPDLSGLASLRELDLAFTGVMGPFPLGGLDELSRLETLKLDGISNLQGDLLSSLTALLSLRFLSLQWTDMAGTIPTSIGNMTSLGNCHLTGSIPVAVGSLKNLVDLNLQTNSLEGVLPSELGGAARLQHVGVSYNIALAGTIPSEFSRCKQLRTFFVDHTSVSGTIPPGFENLANLVDLEIACSDIASPIPLGLCGNSTKIEVDKRQKLEARDCSCCAMEKREGSCPE